MFRLVVLVTIGFCLALLAACSPDDAASPRVDPVEPRPVPRAVRFSDCAELQQYLAEVAEQQSQLEGRYGAIAVEQGAPATDAEVPSGDSAAAPQPEATAGSDGRQFTGTNVQEQGIDEADFVKSDGEYLYLLTGGQFLIFKAWPAAETVELSRTAVAGDPLGLFLFGDRVAVLTQFWPAARADGGGWGSVAAVAVRLFDVSDRAAPVLGRELSLDGTFNAGRLVDGRLHLVLQTVPEFSVPAAFPMEGGGSGAASREVGDGVGTSAGLPAYADTRYEASGPATATGSLSACQDFYRPSVPNGIGIVTLVSLDLADPAADLHSVALTTNSGVVYASGESLFLATRNDDSWFWWPLATEDVAAQPQAATVVHRFALGAEPTYQASGEVPGWVLSAYSMSEYEGTLRIATTDTSGWQGRAPLNAVYLLEQQADQLSQVGALTGLGKPGESIYAVRFLGPRGYVVTFLQTDPLYALDLSDPTRPAVAGELEVPGFSTYLHLVGDTHLLAVGQSTDPWGVELSLFQVSNPAAPTLVDRVSLGEGSYSEAQYEPKAFTYFAAEGVLAIPAVSWSALPTDAGFAGNGVFAGAYVYGVDLETGFTRRGAVDHSRFYVGDDAELWYYPEPIRRSFFIGDEDASPVLYTVSRRGLTATNLDDLTEDLAAWPLPAEEIYWQDVLLAE